MNKLLLSRPLLSAGLLIGACLPAAAQNVVPAFSGYLGIGTGSSGFVEVSGTGYSREPITLSALQSGTGVATTGAGTTFGPDTGSNWGTVTEAALYDAPTGGNLIAWWPISGVAAVNNGATFTLSPFSLTFRDLQETVNRPFVMEIPPGTVLATASNGGAVTAGVALRAQGGTISVDNQSNPTVGTTAGTFAAGNDIRLTAVNMRAPGASDDSAHGYAIGQFWVFNGTIYTAIDVTPGYAAWQVYLPGYPLPTDTVTDATLFAAYGTHLLRSSYTGPALRVQRASDNSTLDVGFLANGLLNTAALDAFLAGTTGRVTIWYDQGPNSNHATAAAASSAPTIVPSNYVGNSRSVVFDIISNISAQGLANEALSIPAGFNGSLADSAVVTVSRQAQQLGNTNIAQLAGTANGQPNSMGVWYTPYQFALLSPGNLLMSQNFPPSLTSKVVGYSANGGSLSIFNGSNMSLGTDYFPPTFTLQNGGNVGSGQAVNGLTANGPFETSAVLIYSGLSSSSLSKLQGSLNYTFDLIPQTEDNWMAVGDSITAGAQGQYSQTYERKAEALINKPISIYNYGYYGQTIQGFSQSFSNYSGVYNPKARNNVMSVFAGTNDIAGGATGAQTFGYLTNFCQQARAAGWKIVVVTMLPRAGLTATSLAEWQNYNAFIRTNWHNIADALADVQASDIMGQLSATGNAALYADGTHPSDLGYTYIAPIIASAVNSLLQ